MIPPEATRRHPAPSLPASRLYAIIDVDVAARSGWAPLDVARAVLDGGGRWLQLRAKTLASGPMLEMASALVELTASAGAILLVNDRADVARLAGAGGVHLGQDDLAPADARTLLGAEATIGWSTHTVTQLVAATKEPVDYVAIGPVFGTITKATGYDAVGLEIVRRAAAGSPPVVAIGGITLDNAASVIAAGAVAVAVISDLLTTDDPAARTRDFLKRMQ